MKNDIEITRCPAHELAALLISLTGFKRATVAKSTSNNPANVSQWLQGRSKMLSTERQKRLLEFLGLQNGKLDGGIVHRWQIGNDFTALRSVLQATETPATMANLTIHTIATDQRHDASSPVLIVIPRQVTPAIILVERSSLPGRHHLRLDAENLGFGHQGQVVELPAHALKASDKPTPTREFLQILAPDGFPGIDKTLTSGNAPISGDLQTPDQLLAEKERTIATLEQDIRDLRCHEAGLRAVLRSTLHALRAIDSNHPLLDKKQRDRIYEEYYLADVDKS